jgi:hypothetical protein
MEVLLEGVALVLGAGVGWLFSRVVLAGVLSVVFRRQA